jgi:hypothetical protein
MKTQQTKATENYENTRTSCKEDLDNLRLLSSEILKSEVLLNAKVGLAKGRQSHLKQMSEILTDEQANYADLRLKVEGAKKIFDDYVIDVTANLAELVGFIEKINVFAGQTAFAQKDLEDMVTLKSRVSNHKSSFSPIVSNLLSVMIRTKNLSGETQIRIRGALVRLRDIVSQRQYQIEASASAQDVKYQMTGQYYDNSNTRSSNILAILTDASESIEGKIGVIQSYADNAKAFNDRSYNLYKTKKEFCTNFQQQFLDYSVGLTKSLEIVGQIDQIIADPDYIPEAKAFFVERSRE